MQIKENCFGEMTCNKLYMYKKNLSPYTPSVKHKKAEKSGLKPFIKNILLIQDVISHITFFIINLLQLFWHTKNNFEV